MAGDEPRDRLGRRWDGLGMPAGGTEALGRLCDAKDALREQIRQLTHSLAVVARGKSCARDGCAAKRMNIVRLGWQSLF
jgi:hypothetical protein